MTLLLYEYFLFIAPSVASNVAAHTINSTSIMVTWQPPLTPNGIIRSYRVKVTSVSDGSASSSGSGFTSSSDETNHYFSAMTTSVVITMLERNTTYQVQVFATTISEGDGSNIITVTTDENSKLEYILSHQLL